MARAEPGLKRFYHRWKANSKQHKPLALAVHNIATGSAAQQPSNLGSAGWFVLGSARPSYVALGVGI